MAQRAGFPLPFRQFREGLGVTRDDTGHQSAIDGVANIGLRPTVGTPEPRLEAHLFDIDADLYGRHLRVSLVEFIRPERKFSGVDALKAQIAEDADTARAMLAAVPAG